MKRWSILIMMIIAVAAIAMAWVYLPAPSSQPGVMSAADLGLLLLDTDEGVSVLGVQAKSIAEQADIRPGDILLRINDTALSTVEKLDGLLMNDNEAMLVIDLQRGKNMFSVNIPLASIVH